MHGPINVKSTNNISEWQMGFNSAFKGLNKVGLYHIPMSSGKNALQNFICFLERGLESIDLSLQYELLETQTTSCLLDDCYGGTNCQILWPCCQR
jgi:hypothetical protein